MEFAVNMPEHEPRGTGEFLERVEAVFGDGSRRKLANGFEHGCEIERLAGGGVESRLHRTTGNETRWGY